MAVDYREVNQQLDTTANQLPYQSTLFQQLGGQKCFAKVDNEGSKIMAVITSWGVYRFSACPFGISTAPGEYQAQMAHVVLEEFYLKGCIVSIDDTVIHGADLESFLSVLDQVLCRMISYNVQLKSSKCYFGNHIFNAKGRRLSDARVQGIREVPEPTSVKAVRSFIGMINYFRDFISGLSGHLIPLYELTKKKSTSGPFRMSYAALLGRSRTYYSKL
jgi:hypothetical protein